MAAVTNLNTGGTVLSKIYSDSFTGSCSYGSIRQKIVSGTLAAPATILIPDVAKIKPPDTVLLELYLTVFATDGTNSSQVITVYNSVNQLTNGGAIVVSANTNDVLINFANNVASVTPMVQLSYITDPTTNSLVLSLSTGAGTQGRPCRYVGVLNQFSSIGY